MNSFRSNLKDFREIFDRGIPLRYIAEPLVSFDAQRDAKDIRKIMENKEFDVVGLREDGVVTGIVIGEELKSGMIGNYKKEFNKDSLLYDWQPILSVLESLRDCTELFVLAMGEVSGIIMRADIEKAPVRMWYFGVLSLLEMQFLRIIRILYPNNEWVSLLNEKRLEKAERLLSARKSRNEQIDLADCLQLSDKHRIVIKNNELRKALGLGSFPEANGFLKKIEGLRNDLAHSQDFVSGRWPELVELTTKIEELLIKCESYRKD